MQWKRRKYKKFLAVASLASVALVSSPASFAATISPLDYTHSQFPVEVIAEGRKENHLDYTIKFASPLKSPFAANNTVWGHLSIPEGPPGRRYPCILVLPVMAAPNIWIEEQFMKRFRKDGFAVFWLEMPYQFHRRPAPLVPSGQVFLARTAKRLAFNFRQSVLDGRRALDWLSRSPYVDPHRIGIFGISLGSLVGSTVYSVDRTPKYAVFLLGGADFPSLIEHSSMTGPFLRHSGIVTQDLAKAWEGLDPLDYKDRNSDKPILLINAWSDTVIPRANAHKLQEAFPGSRQMWVPFGHYTSIFHLIWLPTYVSRRFLSNL